MLGNVFRSRAGGPARGSGRVLGLAGLVLVLSVVSAACGSSSVGSSAAKSATGKAIEVGGICSMSGAGNTVQSCEAAKAYFDKVNSAGGIDGRPIDFTYQDGGTDPTTTGQAGARLIDQKHVVALVGGANSFECTANARLMSSAHVYSLDGSDTDPACWSTPYASPLNNGARLGGAVAAYFLEKVLGQKDVCTVRVTAFSTANASSVVDNIVKSYTGQGFRGVLNWSGGDVTPIVTGARSDGCKGVITAGDSATYVTIMRTAENQGMATGSVAWLGLTTGYTEKVAQTITAPGYWTSSEFLPWTFNTPALTEFKQLQKKTGFALDSTAEGGYLSAKLFVEALRTIKGPINRQSVGEALRSLKNASTFGLTATPFTWGKSNVSSQFLKLQDGKWVPYGGSNGKWYTLPATQSQIHVIVTTR